MLDLRFTLTAHYNGALRELNPLGEAALAYGTAGAVTFKVVLVLLCSLVLLRFRSRRFTEHLLCLVMAAHIGLSLRWHEYHSIFAGYGIDSTIPWHGDTVEARYQNAPGSVQSWLYPHELSGNNGELFVASSR